MNVKRTFTRWRIRCFKLELAQDLTPSLVCVGECEETASSMSDRVARCALRASGVSIPKGAKVRFEPLQEITMEMPVEQFMELAVVTNVTPEDVEESE